MVTLFDSVVNLSLSASILEDKEFIEDDVAATAAPAISRPSTWVCKEVTSDDNTVKSLSVLLILEVKVDCELDTAVDMSDVNWVSRLTTSWASAFRSLSVWEILDVNALIEEDVAATAVPEMSRPFNWVSRFVTSVDKTFISLSVESIREVNEFIEDDVAATASPATSKFDRSVDKPVTDVDSVDKESLSEFILAVNTARVVEFAAIPSISKLLNPVSKDVTWFDNNESVSLSESILVVSVCTARAIAASTWSESITSVKEVCRLVTVVCRDVRESLSVSMRETNDARASVFPLIPLRSRFNKSESIVSVLPSRLPISLWKPVSIVSWLSILEVNVLRAAALATTPERSKSCKALSTESTMSWLNCSVVIPLPKPIKLYNSTKLSFIFSPAILRVSPCPSFAEVPVFRICLDIYIP